MSQITTLLRIKSKTPDGKMIFEKFNVYDPSKGDKKPDKNAVDVVKAQQLLNGNPFEYPRALEGKPTGQWAVPEVLAQMNLKEIQTTDGIIDMTGKIKTTNTEARVKRNTRKTSAKVSNKETLENDFKAE